MRQYKGTGTLEVLQNAKNYNNWIAETFLKHLTGPVLEIGAGTGNLSKHFLSVTPYVISDTDKALVSRTKTTFSNKKLVSFKTFDATKKPPKEFINFFSSVIGINVLEHIEDDSTALSSLHQVLKKKGKLLLLVPAKQFAYTRFDKELGHFRRYEKDELIRKVTDAKFIIDDIYYFNLVGLLSWVIRDKVERKNIQMKPYQIKIFDSIVPLLKRIETVIRPPMGVSLILVARKK